MMLRPYIGYRGVDLYVEDVPVKSIAAQFGTPVYVYSKTALQDAFNAYAKACHGHDALICYAVKANSNLAVLQCLAGLGAGFDIVSAGELERVLAAGGDPQKVIFSGVGKSTEELSRALLSNIGCFNVESFAELRRLDAVAGGLGKIAPLSIRVNPDVDAATHPYISTGLKRTKFGIPIQDAVSAYREARSLGHLRIVGIDCHIGSQLLQEGPLLDALDRLTGLVDRLALEGIEIGHIDIGGGLGIAYQGEAVVPVGQFVGRVFARIRQWQDGVRQGKPVRVLFEPGRSIVGDVGLLLTRVEYLKPGLEKNHAIVDAAMNDLLRPALYDAWHEVVPVTQRKTEARVWDVVGPVCESGDWLARDRMLALAEGDLLALLSAGAYAMSMASNYNTRARGAEIMVDRGRIHLVRERESVTSLFSLERLLPAG